jgi:hypothetical protein
MIVTYYGQTYTALLRNGSIYLQPIGTQGGIVLICAEAGLRRQGIKASIPRWDTGLFLL